MLLQLERPAREGAGHVKRGVAVFEAAVAERDDDFALRHDAAVEIRDAVVGTAVAHCETPAEAKRGLRVSANSSTAATNLSASASSSATDSAIMPRLANQRPRASRSKYNR